MTSSSSGTAPRTRRAWRSLAPLVVLLAGLAGCHKRPATQEDCLAVIDRLVELELAESGFRDPVVTRRWTDELRRQLAPHLSRCEGRRVPESLRACLATARYPEEIEHRCLR